MKKNCVVVIAICFLVLLTSCYRHLGFYPVQGPRALKTPTPVYVGKINYGTKSGVMSLVLDNGEVCTGKWHLLPAAHATGAVGASVPTPPEMSAAWDTVYGSGFYTAHVLGAFQFVKAELKSPQGTVLNLEMIWDGTETSRARGVAKDNNGNIYKAVPS